MGAVAFALVLCVLSGFIWDVQVVGNNRVGTGTLETYLAQNGVAVGKPWQGTARSLLNYRLLRDPLAPASSRKNTPRGTPAARFAPGVPATDERYSAVLAGQRPIGSAPCRFSS